MQVPERFLSISFVAFARDASLRLDQGWRSLLPHSVAFLTGKGPNPLAKPTGPSAEEELAEAIKRQHAAEAGSAQAAGPERSRP